MKPPPFEYFAPQTVDEAVRLLSETDEAVPIAGGQSLMPMLNLRIAQPAALVDLNGLTDLSYVRVLEDQVAVGALTRHRVLETDTAARSAIPVLGELMAHIGHVTIRNRGTVGGSMTHADPAAELPLLAVALDARLVVHGPGGRREIDAADFFVGHFDTALRVGELLVEVQFGRLDSRVGQGFSEVARRHGDFAIASALAMVELAADATIADCRIAVGGVGAVPLRIRTAEAILRGGGGDEDSIARAAAEVVRSVTPSEDLYAAADYRRRVAGVVVTRAVRGAVLRAGQRGGQR